MAYVLSETAPIHSTKYFDFFIQGNQVFKTPTDSQKYGQYRENCQAVCLTQSWENYKKRHLN